MAYGCSIFGCTAATHGLFFFYMALNYVGFGSDWGLSPFFFSTSNCAIRRHTHCSSPKSWVRFPIIYMARHVDHMASNWVVVPKRVIDPMGPV